MLRPAGQHLGQEASLCHTLQLVAVRRHLRLVLPHLAARSRHHDPHSQPAAPHLLRHPAVVAQGPLAGVGVDPQCRQGGQQVGGNHQANRQHEGAGEGAPGVSHLPRQSGHAVPVVEVPEHDVEEGAPVQLVKVHLQPVPGLQVRHTQRRQQHKGHEDCEARGHDGVTHNGEAPVVEVAEQQRHAHQERLSRPAPLQLREEELQVGCQHDGV
mmetsp:Transcript_8117/g.17387  ORF Transcript_8117/g.17387 Transcript_8117/m.17387 type:complete len:212 (-) Transcript_8117:693-1328(-)